MLSDKDWQAQDDARTLARAEEIKANPTKMAAAKVAASRLVSEEETRLQGLKKVSGKKTTVTVIDDMLGGKVSNISIPSVQPIIGGMKFGIGKQPGTW